MKFFEEVKVHQFTNENEYKDKKHNHNIHKEMKNRLIVRSDKRIEHQTKKVDDD